MAAIADLSDYINRATGGNSGTPQNVFWHKSARIGGAAATATIVGRPATLWRYDGQPGPGAIPGAVEAPTNATAGALPFTSPGGSRQAWMTNAWATGLVGGTLILYDRLLHVGGLSGASASPQAVGGALTRNTGGVGNFAFIEIHTQIGTTGTTVTMIYDDDTGSEEVTSTAVAIGNTNFREATRVIMLPLASGDTGIRGVDSITLGVSTGTAGSIAVVVGKPVAYLGVGAPGAPGWRDYLTGLPGIPEIPTGACLSLLWFPSTVTAPEFFGGYSIVES
jgi:hypothetical protein